MALARLLRVPPPLLALLALCAPGVLAADDEPTVTTAPIFLPYYDEDSWSVLRGSILSSNASASQTTYTIFCPTETPQACDLSLEFPFVVVEGPDTVEFHGTYTSTYIANLGCDLDGTTAATCSGYSSYRSGYSNAFHTGPTEISWTSTLTGSQIEYGTLTLAEVPTSTDDSLDITATALSTPTPTDSGMLYVPAATTEPGEDLAASSLPLDTRWAVLVALSSLLVFGIV